LEYIGILGQSDGVPAHHSQQFHKAKSEESI